MDRERTYISMLQAAAQIQHNIALILEGRAAEAHKSRDWICNHLSSAAYEDHASHVKGPLEVHDQLLEVIEGITKMEHALARNLEVLLGENESAAGGSGQMSDLFQLGGDSK